MATARSVSCSLEYDVLGPGSGEPLIVVQGLGDQLTKWDGFPQALAARGFRVIRFDNRDAGLSTRTPDGYSLSDMAADTVAVLDAANAGQAHVVGVSMGGMIGQLIAAEHASRVLSLTSIMSSTGNPELSEPGATALAALMSSGPDPCEDVDAFADHAFAVAKILGSPAYPDDEAEFRATLLAETRRGHDPDGTARQLRAVIDDGARRGRLRRITAPTLVVHGSNDPLFTADHAHDTAASIPGARLLMLPGMGHHLPRALHTTVADAIAQFRTAPRPR